MERITVLVPARAPGGAAIIADSDGALYLAVLQPGGRWEPQPMPEAWRLRLMAMGFVVPMVAT